MASPAPPADPLVYHAASSDWGARIEPNCVVPEHLALPLAIHLPVQHERDRLGEMALAMRIIPFDVFRGRQTPQWAALLNFEWPLYDDRYHSYFNGLLQLSRGFPQINSVPTDSGTNSIALPG